MMGKSKYFIVVVVLLANFMAMMGIAYGAPKEEMKKAWNISFLGTLQVPAQLEIVDGKDVMVEIMKLSEKMEKSYPSKKKNPEVKNTTPEEIAATFDENKIGFYEFALKNNGTYNIALVFAGKLPANMNAGGIAFFETLKSTDKQKQEEIHKLILTKMDEIYEKAPDFKDMFQMEILEFYPFEQMTNKNAQIISVGGSVALRTFKLIQPAAFKVYFINKNSELYVFGVINSGQDRKLWDDMSKEMLSSARWSWL